MMAAGDNRYVKSGTFQGVEWMLCRSRKSDGLVIAPPLIGGHALQQLRLLRPLVRRRLDLLSFSYAGHGGSKGAFSPQASIDNCIAALDLANAMCRLRKIPLYGVASCYGAMPLLHAVHKCVEPMRKLVLINALPHLPWEKIVMEFCRFWHHHRQWQPTPGGLAAALRAYRRELFPHVRHGRQAFGILSRQRVHWSRTIRDLFAHRKFQARPLQATSVMCVYGRYDRLLQQAGFTDWNGYELLIERICPGAQFQCIDGDHFLSGAKVRGRLIQTVVNFLFSPSSPPGRDAILQN